jgi:hemerythrin-like domain-containing protein
MVDENRVGITLIFYIQNFLDFREKMLDKEHHSRIGSVCFSGMSIGGKVLLPIKKSQKQIQKAKVSAKERSSLIEAAKNGDEDAMETLTIEDIDLYSQISRRAMKEDLYSIIDSCFMPCGVECDQYSIIGEIKEVEKIRNIYTKEEIYRMKIESHDLEFMVCINSRDLLGEPQPGRRFKGQIWMQGTLNLVPYKAGPMDQKR